MVFNATYYTEFTMRHATLSCKDNITTMIKDERDVQGTHYIGFNLRSVCQ